VRAWQEPRRDYKRGICDCGAGACARSALHIREFGRNFSIAHGEDIDSADVPGLAVPHLAIDPKHHGAIAADDDFLGVEMGVGVAGEPSAPEVDDRGFAVDAAAVGSRRGVLEDGVIGQERGQGVGVVTVEGGSWEPHGSWRGKTNRQTGPRHTL
jgi:hypothetical protein